VRGKRRTQQLKKSSIESLCVAVELFNRPSQIARDQAVMLMLAHSFEMLLKAIIVQERDTVRDKDEQYAYRFGRCINLVHSDLQLLDVADLPMLWAINRTGMQPPTTPSRFRRTCSGFTCAPE